ncbi:helix-turn-helix domain-containing protein [Paeniclostridium sordellii]|uniref:helix-turn-helix domain-containing protein n=1 Tax=Paraclostridium sordellii TaxID=1505 RepID=UPI0005439C86|nr:helix-turn-helix transcriptional regulator [Paeniclostridium sordellii]MDU4413031.1 helix-turn-helix transcriptional regulator [Paeniclostridium sordellii]MRZ29546.1 helix-turn-helix domain-containing protein [Paeniclostridium sordellii]CEK34169.1 transcriptional regulator,HTH-type transcriptional regulator immR,transcriptional repressor DicA,Predicted transcriptional regulator,Helix-turn-helix domain [[Clostridium] sordellii] [Paeniclostridium sordellii]CEO07581.1 transcriptional regulator 
MFGERLKSLRKSLNLTQKELGEKLNVSGRVVGYYESNDRFPDKDTLTKIADFFEVSVDYLLGRTNSKNNTNIDSLKIDENEKDVEELLEETMSQILDQKGLMLNGQIVDDNDLVLLRNAIRNGIELAKTMQKSKK